MCFMRSVSECRACVCVLQKNIYRTSTRAHAQTEVGRTSDSRSETNISPERQSEATEILLCGEIDQGERRMSKSCLLHFIVWMLFVYFCIFFVNHYPTGRSVALIQPRTTKFACPLFFSIFSPFIIFVVFGWKCSQDTQVFAVTALCARCGCVCRWGFLCIFGSECRLRIVHIPTRRLLGWMASGVENWLIEFNLVRRLR